MKFDPAYHLRTNKQVERALFTDLLRRIAPHLGTAPENCSYVGMGGPYLEDFAVIQTVMGCKKMTSLEISPHVVRRQEFNQPHCRITLTKMSSGEWVHQYKPDASPVVVWFDHSKDLWKEQIQECADLLPKLPPMSILKVSFTCHPWGLVRDSKNDVMQERAEKLRTLFPGMGDFSIDDIRVENFFNTIKTIYARAVAPILADAATATFRPLAMYFYSDGTPMLTVAGIAGPAAAIDEMIKRSRLREWPFATLNWDDPAINVSIPDLGIRERLAIDRRLPDATPTSIVQTLELSLAKTNAESVAIVESYARFARHTPFFIKAAI